MTSNPTTNDATAARRELEHRLAECGLRRPARRDLHDIGDQLEYDITGVHPAVDGHMTVEVERLVGGGFAGQVYRVRLVELATSGDIPGLEVGGRYALKILRPPSGFANLFRDALYFLGYQSPFAARAHPASVRVGVLWQKLIRRAAATRFGDESAVCDTLATFYDAELRSFGEINEWVDGRIWKFEVDDDLFARWSFTGRPPADHPSGEYVHKKRFMADLVELLHEMGAGELARQYEWWSMKSQPNALKRTSAGDDPSAGLTAIDFRAGLTLLPFLPMSPVDLRLIVRGLLRGRLVQFDRPDPHQRRCFLAQHREQFADLEPVITELEAQEAVHQESRPDVTFQGLRLLVDRALRSRVVSGLVTMWKHLGDIDDRHAVKLAGQPWLLRLLVVLSFIPGIGRKVTRIVGHDGHRAHLRACLTSPSYLWRTMRASRIEALIGWCRGGRVSPQAGLELVDRPVRFWHQRICYGLLPPTWHRFIVDSAAARERIRQSVQFTVRFLRVPEFREQTLLEQVELGRSEGMLTDAEADKIVAQIEDPFIQKYLKCLAVHLCTVPITQVVMVLVGAAVVAYCLGFRQLGWAESLALGTAAAAAIQLLPISPGSTARGAFVLFLMIRERDFKNYYIAAPVSFLHVIGYLAFPFQMVTSNPALARFLAGRWTRNAVHLVPVFGEHGGLLEHGVFDAMFNLPLSVPKSFRRRPLLWSLGAAVIIAMLALIGLGAYWHIWEWR